VTLPASFPLSMSQVNTELGRATNATTSLLESATRTLAQVPSGPVSFSNLLGKASLTVTGNSDGRSYNSSGGAGNANSFPTVTVTGGQAPYTYSWTFTSNPQGASISSANSANPTVFKAFSSGSTGSYTSVLQCQVTDNLGSVKTATGISADADWSP